MNGAQTNCDTVILSGAESEVEGPRRGNEKLQRAKRHDQQRFTVTPRDPSTPLCCARDDSTRRSLTAVHSIVLAQ